MTPLLHSTESRDYHGHVCWSMVHYRTREEVASVEVEMPGGPTRSERVVELDGVPMTTTNGIVPGAVWRFLNKQGETVATAKIIEILGVALEGGRLFRMELDA